MPVGQGALVGFNSYLAVGRETTYGTYVTGTAGLNFVSASMKTTMETKIIEQVSTSRTHSEKIQTGKVVEGDIELMYSPRNLACNYLLVNAFGGGVPSVATATGETAGGGAFTHTVTLNNFDATYASLSINMRKGDSASAKIFEYSGLRVNEMTLNAELDEPLMMSFSLIGKDSSLSTNDVSSSLNTLSQNPLSFADGRVSVETSFASLTSTSFWHVESVEFSINNNLKADADARRIGSNTLQVLPPGIANLELKMTIRFDTSTAFDAMINGTKLSAELEFRGPTMTGSAIREGIKLQFPTLYVSDAGDPEIGGPDEVLKSEVTFAVLRDNTSATGYAVRALVTNLTSSYA